MNPILAQLDDRAALRVLDRVVTGHTDAPRPALELTPELRQALAAHCGLPSSAPAATAGELARAALQLLAADPELQPRILALAQHPEPERFDLGLAGSVAALTLALCALQTQVDLGWDAKKRFRLSLKKKSASDALLKQFLAKLIAFIPDKPTRGD